MTFLAPDDRRWLDAAARQAAPLLGTTGSHPTVGAILVEPISQKLIGRAVTGAGGTPEAIASALDEASAAARGSTLYATLSPSLDLAGRVLAAGISRAVIGLADPEQGQAALDCLRAGGVVVPVADHEASKRLHEGYITYKTKGRPFVIARLAVSADGKVGLPDKRNAPFILEPARRWAEMLRATADAVMIGWGTARSDDPVLDVRLRGLEDRRPLRIVVAGFRTYETTLNLFANVGTQAAAVIVTQEKTISLPPGVELIRVKGIRGRPELAPALALLAARGVQTLLVEAGPTLLESLLAAGLIDRFHLLRSEVELGPAGVPAAGRGGIEARMGAAGFSLVDHRLLGADNLRTFERVF